MANKIENKTHFNFNLHHSVTTHSEENLELDFDCISSVISDLNWLLVYTHMTKRFKQSQGAVMWPILFEKKTQIIIYY